MVMQTQPFLYQQSVELHKKLDELGVKNEFITITGGKHGGFDANQNRDLNTKIVAFLKSLGL